MSTDTGKVSQLFDKISNLIRFNGADRLCQQPWDWRAKLEKYCLKSPAEAFWLPVFGAKSRPLDLFLAKMAEY